MIAYFLTPPGLYILIAFVFILSLVVYWQRKPIKRELRRWRGKEVTVGPVKFELQEGKKQGESISPQAGVSFGQENDFSGAKVKNVAGRDIHKEKVTVQASSAKKEAGSSRGGAIQGVDFGKRSQFKNTEIENIAGRDLEQKE